MQFVLRPLGVHATSRRSGCQVVPFLLSITVAAWLTPVSAPACCRVRLLTELIRPVLLCHSVPKISLSFAARSPLKLSIRLPPLSFCMIGRNQ
jgi:hypothetical protein